MPADDRQDKEASPMHQPPSLVSSLEDLLGLPFDEALRCSHGLRQHIASQKEDAREVADEFREHWGPNAPGELRVVLSEVTGLKTRFQCNETRDLDVAPVVERGESSQGEEGTVNQDAPRSHKLRAILNSPEFNTIEWGGWLPGEQLAPTETADDLLRLPFGEALHSCAALRRYLEDQTHLDVVEKELAQKWGSDAPTEFRDFLTQLLSLAPVDPMQSETHEAPLWDAVHVAHGARSRL